MSTGSSDEFAPVEKYAHRFDIGDEVWELNGPHTLREWATCSTCKGKGRIPIEGARNEARCPDCEVSSGRIWFDSARTYYTTTALTVGLVRVTVTTERPYGAMREAQSTAVTTGQWRHVEYMANETGIGSGRVYREDRLYPDEASVIAAAAARGWVTEAEARSPVEASLSDRQAP